MPVPHFSIPSWFPHIDVVVLALFGALVAIDALRNGTRRAIAFAIAGPLALLTYALVPGSAFIGATLKAQQAPIQAAIFAVLFAALFFLVYRMCGQYGISGAFPLPAVIAGISATIVLVICWLQIPGLGALWPLPQIVHNIFLPAYQLYWLLGAYIALALSKK